MTTELKIPTLGESITEVTLGPWLKSKGDRVNKDDPIITLESEKATVELPAPVSGTLTELLKQAGDIATVGEVIGRMEDTLNAASPTRPPEAGPPPNDRAGKKEEPSRTMLAAVRALAQVGPPAGQSPEPAPPDRASREDRPPEADAPAHRQPAAAHQPAAPRAQPPASTQGIHSTPAAPDRTEEVVPMSRLRRTVAERLVAARNTMALLTTVNEIDLSAALALRKEFGESFQEKFQVKLGLMSFFVRAAVEALKLFPQVNAEVRGEDIVYHHYHDIGVAVGGGKGLVVPVLRNAERLSFAQIEAAISDFARRAKENRLGLEELRGGTFTITNGGVYGSLLSTPIVNPPQSGILGMHAIQERPVARDGQVVIRPMMYVALSYDHRIVDGREAVSFLKRVKETVEEPVRLVLEV